MDQTHLKELLQRYLNNTLAVEELEELIHYLKQKEQEETLQQVIEQALISKAFAAPADDARKDQIFQNILQKAAEQAPLHDQPLQPIKRRTVMWKAAAAVLILIAGATTYWVTGIRQKTAPIAAYHKTDVPPGGNKAMLTLADGTRIELDSAIKGTLARQGGATIQKTGSGQLDYDMVNQSAAAVGYNTVTTPRGGQYRIVLPDGTKVWLNAASSLHFPTAFHGHERRVELTGEAYFEVTAREAQPFKVTVQEMEVQVLGTHFNVNAYTDESSINTTLLEGRVNVAHQGKVALLKPGQQAQVNDHIRVVEHPDIETLMAWKDGRFSYNGMPLENIMRQISRWYDVEVVFEDKISDTYSMEISRDMPLSKLLRFLELSGGVHFTVNEKTIIVKK